MVTEDPNAIVVKPKKASKHAKGADKVLIPVSAECLDITRQYKHPEGKIVRYINHIHIFLLTGCKNVAWLNPLNTQPILRRCVPRGVITTP